jgi:3-hydroxy-9,10-secoandrosta-1,3,5(10)-triene-9,17-dione monooxygenase
LTESTLLERARALAPVLRDRAEETERLGRLPDATIRDLRDAGLLRALQPRRFGGDELPLSAFYQAQIEIAKACGSSGWVLGVLGIHNWMLAMYPEQAQRDVWEADADVLAATSFMPAGQVEPVDGGFRLSGLWGFASGCDACRWAMLGAIVGKTGDGLPDFRVFLVPDSDYSIVDDWQVAGLRGTGSKSIRVTDAFVPEHRILELIDTARGTEPGRKLHDALLYRLPFASVFAYAIAVAAVGIAEGALEAFRERASKRLLAYSRERQAELAPTQVRLGEAAGEIDCARMLLQRDVSEMERLVAADQAPTFEQRGRYRFDASYLVLLCKRAVERLMAASGGGALYDSNPLQRATRDLMAMSAHAKLNPDEASELWGRVQLGLPPNDALI